MFSRRLFSSSLTAKKMASIRSLAPAFTAPAVVNKQFAQLDLHKDYKNKWVVLFFYPFDFTYVCPTEIIEYSERANEFQALGAEVIGVSTDSKFSHLAWINQQRKSGGLGDMKIPLVSDFNKTISKDYGVLCDEGMAYRGTFIIDGKGIIRQITINDLSVGRNVDETLRLVEAFQFADKHGEVCPVNWKKGEKTITPEWEKKDDYFGSKK